MVKSVDRVPRIQRLFLARLLIRPSINPSPPSHLFTYAQSLPHRFLSVSVPIEREKGKGKKWWRSSPWRPVRSSTAVETPPLRLDPFPSRFYPPSPPPPTHHRVLGFLDLWLWLLMQWRMPQQLSFLVSDLIYLLGNWWKNTHTLFFFFPLLSLKAVVVFVSGGSSLWWWDLCQGCCPQWCIHG